MAKGNFLRFLRISILLYVFAMVALGAWLAKERSTDWDDTLYVAVYPINGDGSARAAEYIERLEPKVYKAVAEFIRREGQRYGIAVRAPVEIELGEQVHSLPPQPPFGASPPQVMLWSLKLRYWAYRAEAAQTLPSPDVRMFVVYRDPAGAEGPQHSLGLEKGLLGVVNAYASRSLAARNNVVITHELLHTLGASDKYDPATNLPLHPDGYSEPGRRPLHPQRTAEIMGGRIPRSAQTADMPESLAQTVVGDTTAAEINWTSAD